jgi:hypothetical protein
VLVLTGYADLELAVAATRRGAWDFKSKTILLDDEWVAVFRGLVEAGRALRAAAEAVPIPHSDEAVLAILLTAIDEAARPAFYRQRRGSGSGTVPMIGEARRGEARRGRESSERWSRPS